MNVHKKTTSRKASHEVSWKPPQSNDLISYALGHSRCATFNTILRYIRRKPGSHPKVDAAYKKGWIVARPMSAKKMAQRLRTTPQTYYRHIQYLLDLGVMRRIDCGPSSTPGYIVGRMLDGTYALTVESAFVDCGLWDHIDKTNEWPKQDEIETSLSGELDEIWKRWQDDIETHDPENNVVSMVAAKEIKKRQEKAKAYFPVLGPTQFPGDADVQEKVTKLKRHYEEILGKIGQIYDDGHVDAPNPMVNEWDSQREGWMAWKFCDGYSLEEMKTAVTYTLVCWRHVRERHYEDLTSTGRPTPSPLETIYRKHSQIVPEAKIFDDIKNVVWRMMRWRIRCPGKAIPRPAKKKHVYPVEEQLQKIGIPTH